MLWCLKFDLHLIIIDIFLGKSSWKSIDPHITHIYRICMICMYYYETRCIHLGSKYCFKVAFRNLSIKFSCTAYICYSDFSSLKLLCIETWNQSMRKRNHIWNCFMASGNLEVHKKRVDKCCSTYDKKWKGYSILM